MLHNESEYYSAKVFLDSWSLEIQGGYTPDEQLDVTTRLNEYLDPDVPKATEARLLAEVTRESERLLREARESESTWATPTMNDRISAAFEALRARGIFTSECAGLTLQDGWARVGVEARPTHRGAVFFHQQDVFDALHGQSLLLAFGAAQDAVETPEQARAVATAALEALAEHGVPASWTGRVEDRIEVLPFAWQRRRWTAAPEGQPVAVSWKKRGKQLTLFSVRAEELEQYVQPVNAYDSTCGFDAELSYIMRGVWKHLGGERGQVGHAGTPHTFVRSGEQTSMMPRDALTNLAPADAAFLRRTGMKAREPVADSPEGAEATAVPSVPAPEPAAKKPWWKFW